MSLWVRVIVEGLLPLVAMIVVVVGLPSFIMWCADLHWFVKPDDEKARPCVSRFPVGWLAVVPNVRHPHWSTKRARRWRPSRRWAARTAVRLHARLVEHAVQGELLPVDELTSESPREVRRAVRRLQRTVRDLDE